MSSRQPDVFGAQRNQLRLATGDAHAIRRAGVNRVGQDHLVARVDGRQKHVENAAASAGGDDRAIVSAPAELRNVRRRRGTQRIVTVKRKIAVRGIVVDRAPRRRQRGFRRTQIRVHVFQAQNRRIASRIGFVADTIDADPRNLQEAVRTHPVSLLYKSPFCDVD